MLPMLYRKILRIVAPPPPHLHFLKIPFPKSISSQISDCTAEEPHSFTLSYLINSCGLSPEAALSASKKVTLKSTQQPDSVLQFLKNHGFNNTHIANVIAFHPRFLLSKVESTLQPKIQFFQSLGLSNPEMAELINSNPQMLYRGLESQLIPSVDFLRNILQTNDKVVKGLKRSRWLLSSNLEKLMGPNIDLLRELGVPNSVLENVVMNQPRSLMQKPDVLKEVIGRVESFGFERGSFTFMVAIHVMSSMSKTTWAAKVELLKSLGWSEDDILLGFRKIPGYMVCSEKKIKSGMDFFVKKMKLEPSLISRHPMLLMFSLRKRVIPRSTVWSILKRKDLVEEEGLIRILYLSEDRFLKKYLRKYEKEIPYLMKAYEGEFEFRWLDDRGSGGEATQIKKSPGVVQQ